MSDLDYDALRKVAEAATPGPWDQDGYDVYETRTDHGDVIAEAGLRTADARHVATFDPPTMLRLLDLAQSAEADRAAVERVRALVDQKRGSFDGYQYVLVGDVRAALDRKEDQ